MIKKVAIIIVNWNGIRFLENCLNSVYNQTYQNFDVYFVDNGSKDGSVVFVRKNFPKIKIIELDHNTGFAKGNNEGINEAFKDQEVEYIVCLNNDTIVDKNWLEELVKTAEKDVKIGSVSSKAYFDDKITIQNAGLEFHKTIQTNKKGGISVGFGLNDKEAPELSNDIEIFAAGGVAPLYKREVLESLLKRDKEVFDEDFFAYVEDFDLGFRIRGLGYKSFLSANAKLIHLHSKTSGVASPFKTYYCERNIILAAIKNLPLFDLLLFPFRSIRLKFSYLFNKNESVEKLKGNVGILGILWILMKANLSVLFLIPKFLRKRRKIISEKSFGKSPERAEGEFNDFERSFSRYVFAETVLRKNFTVLDIASGVGYGTFFLSRSVNKIYGADINDDSVNFAQNNFSGKNIEYRVEDGTKLDFKDHFFDAVISFETIEHINDYELFLLEIKRVLKKDGILIISTPNKNIASPKLTTPLHDYHVREWSLDEFKELLLRYFSIEKIYVQKFKWPAFVVLLRRIYADFFRLFGQRVLRGSLKILQFMIFSVVKANKNNAKIINRDTISNFLNDTRILGHSDNYKKGVYYPKELKSKDELFGIQIFLLRNK